MKDSAEPHSSSRVREPVRWSRRGRNASWMIEGSSGLALARYGNSSITTGTGRSALSASSASTASAQSAKWNGLAGRT